MFGHAKFQPVIDLIISLAEMCAKEPRELPPPAYDRKTLQAKVKALVGADIAAGYKETVKQARYAKLDAAEAKALAAVPAEEFSSKAVEAEIEQLKYDHVRAMILDSGARIDGRDTKTVRPIVCEVGVLPRAHGSALFTRGETQALVVTTLGTGDDEQIIDALEGEYREHFMLHYNFPPYSVGETGRMGSPGRRGNRPRQACMARGSSDASGKGQIPVHAARRIGNYRIQRFKLDGVRLRRVAFADGCRCADALASRGYRHGPHQGRSWLCRIVGHSR